MAGNLNATLTTATPMVQASMSNASYKGSKPVKGTDYWTDADKAEIIELAKNEIATGLDGKSAYAIAVSHGYVGTEEEWLESLKGETGPQGPQGETGATGEQGLPGADGYSPQLTVSTTNEGATITATDKTGTTVALVKNGEKGDTGARGSDGYTPVKGTDYYTQEDKTALKDEVVSELGVEYLTNSDVLAIWNSL